MRSRNVQPLRPCGKRLSSRFSGHRPRVQRCDARASIAGRAEQLTEALSRTPSESLVRLHSLVNVGKDALAFTAYTASDALWTLQDAFDVFEQQGLSLLPSKRWELSALAAAAAVGTASLANARSAGTYASDLSDLPPEYDPESFASYFKRRPLRAAGRAAEILYYVVGFAFAVLASDGSKDAVASALTELLSNLGPTFVKVGQALSIRSDLLSPAYLKALSRLQDNISPFDSTRARQIVETELGAPIGQLFTNFDTPVASASLGQVYKTQLQEDGSEVAVKVQRPGITEQIALDLTMLHAAAPALKRYYSLNSDLQGLVNEYGSRFWNECDLVKEMKNGERFIEAMRERNFDSVSAATPFRKYSTTRVLTTKWISGNNLDELNRADVPRLVATALQAYLVQLLDVSTIHADPHPGNLKVTEDGQLIVLDWGLVCEVSKERQLSLIDYISNLVTENYSSIPNDLVALGFVVEGSEEKIANSEVVDVLSDVLSQLSSGGGAKKLDIDAIQNTISELVARQGNLFQVPTYFLYILRCFSTLEGIALSADENYSIVQECWPYLAYRLVTDDSERTHAALRRMLYSEDGKTMDFERIEKIATSVSTFGDVSQNGVFSNTRSGGANAGELASLVLSPQGSQLQNLFVDELARLVDVSIADFVSQYTPIAFRQRLEEASPRHNESEYAALQTAFKLRNLMQDSLRNGNGEVSAPEMLQMLGEHGRGLAALSGRLNAALLRRAVDRAAKLSSES